MMHIEKNKYKVDENNYHKISSIKKQIIIGSSLRKNSNHLIRLKHKDYGQSKKWNTFTISRKGEIYQHFDDKYYSDFIGNKDIDKHSISIVLENMGCLFEIEENKYVNWLDESCDKKNVVEKEWRGYEYWEKFPPIQIESLMTLCNELCNKHNIPKAIINFIFYHENINKFKGIVFRGNYIDDSSDMTPLLDIDKLNELLIR